ncbi:MAG: GNAT family N-acetyltransferase [Oscillospiraceae bacterium]|jgi:ribosomal protein S18 acetylase RimI-like enzyme|nr:GNAT family N-acetyltransferase [Oscillospiraceae bacterium]
MEIRKAAAQDLAAIMAIVRQAQDFFEAYGIEQWRDGYPNEAQLVNDIQKGEAFVVCEEEATVGFAVLSLNRLAPREEASAERYALVRLIAIDERFQSRGFATELMDYADLVCKKSAIGCIRINIHPDNLAMRRTLKKCGFSKSEEVLGEGEEPFWQYEKQIKPF